jgi:hypothetical protein
MLPWGSQIINTLVWLGAVVFHDHGRDLRVRIQADERLVPGAAKSP